MALAACSHGIGQGAACRSRRGQDGDSEGAKRQICPKGKRHDWHRNEKLLSADRLDTGDEEKRKWEADSLSMLLSPLPHALLLSANLCHMKQYFTALQSAPHHNVTIKTTWHHMWFVAHKYDEKVFIFYHWGIFPHKQTLDFWRGLQERKRNHFGRHFIFSSRGKSQHNEEYRSLKCWHTHS